MDDFSSPNDFILLARERSSAPDRKVMDMPPHFREIYYYLLRRAAPAPVSDGKISLEQGQCVVSAEEVLRELSWLQGFKRLRYTESQYKNAMNTLAREGMIERRKVSRGSLVTITSYEQYSQEILFQSKEILRKGIGLPVKKRQDEDISRNQQPETQAQSPGKPGKKPEKQAPQEYFDLVDDFIKKHSESFPNLAKRVEKNEISAWAAEVEKLVRIDRHEFGVVKSALMWAAGDDFWGPNIRSLLQVRKKSGNNDQKKFENILAAWERGKRKSSSRPRPAPAQYRQGKDYGQSDAGFLINSK